MRNEASLFNLYKSQQEESKNIYNDSSDNNNNFGNISEIKPLINNPINSDESSKKETKELNELDQDEFIKDFKNFLVDIIPKVNDLILLKDKIEFPKLNGENDFKSYMKYLENIDKIHKEHYNKNSYININISKYKILNDKLAGSINNILKEYQNFENLIVGDFEFIDEAGTGNKKKKIEKNKGDLRKDLCTISEIMNKQLLKLYVLKKFIKEDCHIPNKKLDQRGDFVIPNLSDNIKRGTQIYYPPYGWMGIGLNVLGNYLGNNEDGDGIWLKRKNDSKWTNAYIGFNKNFDNDKIKKELYDYIVNGKNLEEKEINFLDKRHWVNKISKGIILYPKVQEAEKNCCVVELNKINYKILLMARVKINEIIEPENGEFWALDKQFVRIYRIIFKEIRKDEN